MSIRVRSNRPSILLAAVLSVVAWSPAGAESLKERQQKILEVVPRVSQAVVAIQGTGEGALGTGSGVIVSRDGLILTAGHVLEATGDDLRVTLPDGRQVKAKSLGRDMNRDAAMAQITDEGEWPFVELAPVDSVEQGEWCLALGHPGGFDIQRGAPLRAGRLWENDAEAFYRSDCAVSGGDSGGPLFDLEGRLIGIHSSISLNLAENRHVPVGVFRDEWDRLKKGDRWGDLNRSMRELRDPDSDRRGRRERSRRNDRRSEEESRPREPAPSREPAPAQGRAWMGVELNVLDGSQGVVVTGVTDGSPADKAGLQLEDVIAKVDDKPLRDLAAITDRVRSASPGDSLNLTVIRKGAEREVVVKLEAAP